MSKDEKKPALQRIGMVTYEGRESKSKKGDGELDRAPYNPSPEAVQDVEDFLIAVGLPREIKPPPEGWGVPAWYNHDNLDPVSKKTSPPLNRRHLIDAVTQARGSAQRRKASSQELQHFDTAESFINYFTKAGLDHEEINALATVLLTPALHGDNAIHTGKHQITVKKGTGEILIDNERIYLPGDMVSSESTWEAAKDRIEKVPVRYYGDSAAYQRVDAPAIMDDTLYPKAQQKPSKRELIDAVTQARGSAQRREATRDLRNASPSLTQGPSCVHKCSSCIHFYPDERHRQPTPKEIEDYELLNIIPAWAQDDLSKVLQNATTPLNTIEGQTQSLTKRQAFIEAKRQLQTPYCHQKHKTTDKDEVGNVLKCSRYTPDTKLQGT